jgi:hypothetical protein
MTLSIQSNSMLASDAARKNAVAAMAESDGFHHKMMRQNDRRSSRPQAVSAIESRRSPWRNAEREIEAACAILDLLPRHVAHRTALIVSTFSHAGLTTTDFA